MIKVRKRLGKIPRIRGSYSQKPRIGRAFIGPPVEAAVRGQAWVLERGEPYPTRPVGRFFYRNGVVHPMAHDSHFRSLGWGVPAAPKHSTVGKLYVKVARCVWRWKREHEVVCACGWCRRSQAHRFDYAFSRSARRRGLVEVEDGDVAELAAIAVAAAGVRHAWVGCEGGADRKLCVDERVRQFLAAAAQLLAGERRDVVRASVAYAARRMVDGRCGLGRLIEAGLGHVACAWVHYAARRHPGAGRKVFPCFSPTAKDPA